MDQKKIKEQIFNEHNLSEREILKLIAFLMNCDNLEFKFKPKDKYNYKSFKGVSAVGLHNCSKLILNGIHYELFNKDFINHLLTVKNLKPDQELKPNKKYATGIGLKCITMLWKVDNDFKLFAEAIFYRATHGKQDEGADNKEIK